MEPALEIEEEKTTAALSDGVTEDIVQSFVGVWAADDSCSPSKQCCCGTGKIRLVLLLCS